MKRVFKIIVVLMFIHLSGHTYAQKIYANKSVKINKKVVNQCQKIVDDINSMSLKCDTTFLYGLKGTCFDEQGRLRKYFYNPDAPSPNRDAAGEYVAIFAYYDENGNLVYMKHRSGNNCVDNIEHYYVHNGLIVDLMLDLACGCCEEGEEYLSKEEINSICLVVGSKLTNTLTFPNHPLTSFIRADTLLARLKSKEYRGMYGEIYLNDNIDR